MLDYQDNFLDVDLAEVESPYLRDLIEERGGQIDDDLKQLMRLEKYMRGVRPKSAMMIIRMMISGIAHTYPVESEIIRRELANGTVIDPAAREALEKDPPDPITDFDVWVSLRSRDRAKARVQDGTVRFSKNRDG
jgi:hypothetical protein